MSDESKTSRQSDRQREELTAYLDGELSAEVAATVEARMASDERYRSELQQFSSVWDCLDELPQTDVEERFTQSTVEMVTLSVERDIQQYRSESPRWRVLLITASCIACALAGYALANLLWQDPDRPRLADLPVVANPDLYPKTLLEKINREVSRADQQAILRWVRDYWRKHRDEIVARLPSDVRRRMRPQHGDRPGREFAQLHHLFGRHHGNDPPLLRAKQLRELERHLSNHAHRKLAQTSSSDERQQMLRRWVQQTMRASMMRRQLDSPRNGQRNGVREQDLEQFFVEALSGKSRQRLLSLPREQMKEELRRMTMRDMLPNGRHGPPHRDGPPR